nr:hypothetical protein [Tanacetum cinerariifolium]
MDTATVLASGAAEVPTSSGSIPTATEVPTGSDMVPTTSLVFATTTMVTPYRRRKGKEVMPLERRVELISDLVRYQDNYAKVHKFQTQQRKPWSKKKKKDYYMAVIRRNLRWKEDAKRLKRKGLSLEQESEKKFKPLDEVPKEVKSPDEVLEEKVKEMMHLVPIKEVYVEALQVKHPIIDWKHMGREDLNQLWALVKESLNNRSPTNDKEMELWVELKSYKLQVDNYSQMANDLILKIYKIANSPRQQGGIKGTGTWGVGRDVWNYSGEVRVHRKPVGKGIGQ